ncbi:hypothetical protein [uncultured Albimonas sp.]|uniref:hypothetical protein n=1 Tax=uncultured Albimonas sp. TaxID=1331701 RepID=UPI0030EE3A2F
MAPLRPETDHHAIRRWTESHGGRPAKVDGDEGAGALRLDFEEPEPGLTEIDWPEFFEIFERRRLAVLLPDDRRSRCSAIVSRDG